MLGKATTLLIGARQLAKRSLPVAGAAAAAALSVGAYSAAAAAMRHHHTPRPTFSLSGAPASAQAVAGSTVHYTITVRRGHAGARVRLGFSTRLPAGIAARFLPVSTRGRQLILVLRTSTRLRPGRYQLHVRATVGRSSRGLVLTLTVTTARNSPAGSAAGGQSPPFAIAGDVAAPLQPGAPQPIDLRITNPNSVPLIIDSVDVGVQAIDAPRATATLPCAANNFAVQQFSGSLPLIIPAASRRSLSQLGVPADQWPALSLLDLPVDQDGCQGASLTLAYHATARLG